MFYGHSNGYIHLERERYIKEKKEIGSMMWQYERDKKKWEVFDGWWHCWGVYISLLLKLLLRISF